MFILAVWYRCVFIESELLHGHGHSMARGNLNKSKETMPTATTALK